MRREDSYDLFQISNLTTGERRAGGAREPQAECLRSRMSTAVKQFHEEEQIGKTYDWQVARRLLRYLKPYVRLLIPALILTLLLNLLGILQPLFTEWTIDGYILPRTTVTLVSLKFREYFFGSFYLTIAKFALF